MALRNLAWAFQRDRLDRAGGYEAVFSGPSVTIESAFYRLMPGGSFYRCVTLSCGDFFHHK
jgi:hypothetical protein